MPSTNPIIYGEKIISAFSKLELLDLVGVEEVALQLVGVKYQYCSRPHVTGAYEGAIQLLSPLDQVKVENGFAVVPHGYKAFEFTRY